MAGLAPGPTLLERDVFREEVTEGTREDTEEENDAFLEWF